MEYRRQTLNTAFDFPSKLKKDYIYRVSINEYSHDRYHGRFSIGSFLKRHFLNLICCCFQKRVDDPTFVVYKKDLRRV